MRDRNTPIAKLVPLQAHDLDDDEMSLVAEGLLRLPERPFDAEAFLAEDNTGDKSAGPKVSRAQLNRAMQWVRGDIDVSVLGRKLRNSSRRTGTKK